MWNSNFSSWFKKTNYYAKTTYGTCHSADVNAAVKYGAVTNWKDSQQLKYPLYIELVGQRLPDPGCRIASAIKFCTVTSDVFRMSFDTNKCVEFSWIEQQAPDKRLIRHSTIACLPCETKYRPCCVWIFEVAKGFFENIWTPVVVQGSQRCDVHP